MTVGWGGLDAGGKAIGDAKARLEHPGRICRNPQTATSAGVEAYHDAPRPIIEAACWAHARRKFFVLADITTKARGKLMVILRR
jgi:hypothetical protein